MHNLHETMQWLRENDTAEELGFNPNGMCQKIARLARDLPQRYPSAKAAQDATPKEHRFYKVADLRKGMVVYYDDPNDSNPFGHVATLVGRVKGFDPDSLHDVLVKTNSVISGQLVVVRGDYFEEHWGDEFQFGSDMVNGTVVDVFQRPAEKLHNPTIQDFRDTRGEWDVKILDDLGVKSPDIRQKARQIKALVAELPTDEGDSRVNAFKDRFESDRILKLSLLNEAVKDGRGGKVLEVRNELRAILKKLIQR